MEHKKKLTSFIQIGNFSDESIQQIQNELFWNDQQLIRHTFELIKYELKIYRKNIIIDEILINSTKLLAILCNRQKFNADEIVINRKRIKKYREAILIAANKYNNRCLFDAANKFDEIVLEKDIKVNDLILLLKNLVDRKEDINIIKRLLNTNKNAIIKRTELFDYAFKLAIKALEEDSAFVYYYISLLKIFYSSKIDFKYYTKILDSKNLGNDIFVDEIYNIIHGIKRSLTTAEILNKYGIITNLSCPNIILPESPISDEFTYTLDAFTFGLRDDAVSIVRKDNYYLVGIHITDPTYIIKPNSMFDLDARNNFKCIFLPGDSVRILNQEAENSISLNRGKFRRVITLYARVGMDGEVIDYNFVRNVIRINENFKYEEGDNLIKNGKGKVADDLRKLYDLALALESRNPKKSIYWHKKDIDSIDKEPIKHMSDKIISELMVLYNHLIAEVADREDMPYVYRVHNNSYIKDLLSKLNIETNESVDRLISNIYLPSKYSTIPIYHYGLNVPKYSHSSNPGRSYPDLYNEFLFHYFHFRDLEMKFSSEMHERLVEYFNQRNVEIELLKAEYSRAKKIKKD